MNRMQYEMIVRKAHNCGRFGVYGANADIFSTLESRIATKNDEKPILNFEIGLAMGEVITWMTASFQKLHDEYKDDDRIRETLNKCLSLLAEPSMENIDKAGDLACEVLGISANI